MKKKRTYTPEQKAQRKIYLAEYRLKNKAKQKIYKAKWHQENKEEQKRQMQEWYKENPDYQKEWVKKNPDYIPPCKIENPDYQKETMKRFQEANPGYVPPCAVDLGFWIVYVITNYNGLGDNYAGQTQNIYNRMATHKSQGKLNTDTYTIVKKCDTLEDALEIESAVHNFGYHGDASTESGK